MKNNHIVKNFEKILWISSGLMIIAAVLSFYDSKWNNFILLITSVIGIYVLIFLFHAGRRELAVTTFCYFGLGIILMLNWMNNGLKDTSLLLLPTLYFFSAQSIKDIHFKYIFLLSAIYVIGLSFESQYGLTNYYSTPVRQLESLTTGIEVFLFLTASAYFAWMLHFTSDQQLSK